MYEWLIEKRDGELSIMEIFFILALTALMILVTTLWVISLTTPLERAMAYIF